MSLSLSRFWLNIAALPVPDITFDDVKPVCVNFNGTVASTWVEETSLDPFVLYVIDLRQTVTVCIAKAIQVLCRLVFYHPNIAMGQHALSFAGFEIKIDSLLLAPFFHQKVQLLRWC